tara:strand:+ start:2720 stop:2923 length:204 start_codon:yes stop_codon:yes gene_type:complete
MKQESYGLALTEKQLKFMVKCIDIAQKSESIHPDAEESDLIRRLGRKYEEFQDKDWAEYDSEYDLKQ